MKKIIKQKKKYTKKEFIVILIEIRDQLAGFIKTQNLIIEKLDRMCKKT